MKSLIIITTILFLFSVGFGKETNQEKRKIGFDDILQFDNSHSITLSENLSIPKSFKVKQNYPNPFNASTVIEYDLPIRAKTSIVIYNSLGQQIRTLENNTKEAGSYRTEWDGKDDLRQEIASGIYFYVVLADEYYSINKMALIK